MVMTNYFINSLKLISFWNSGFNEKP